MLTLKRISVQSDRLVLALLDPHVARKVGIVASNLLDGEAEVIVDPILFDLTPDEMRAMWDIPPIRLVETITEVERAVGAWPWIQWVEMGRNCASA